MTTNLIYRSRRAFLLALFFFCLSPAAPANAEEAVWSATLENDSFSGMDSNYTQGLKLSYIAPPNKKFAAADWVASNILDARERDRVHFGFAVGQSIFTPQDIDATEPLPNQHPYAGWLYVSGAVTVRRRRVTDALRMEVGVIGPSALGEEAQNSFHRFIGTEEAAGWDNQLHNEPGFVLNFERQWRPLFQTTRSGVDMDFTPSAGVALGNVRALVKAGATFRVGQDFKGDAGPPRIRPSLAGSGYYSKGGGDFSWYVFAGVEGRAVARNVFLDGNTFRDSLSVEKRNFVGDVQSGVAVRFRGVRLAYTHVFRTKEFVGQETRQLFGAVSLSARF